MTRLRLADRPRAETMPKGDEAFLDWLGGPTAFRVPGRDRSRVRVATTLLHGNEPSGMRAMRRWLRAGRQPAVDSLLIIASVEAAHAGRRALEGRRDLNRCFHGPFDDDEGRLAADVLATIRDTRPEALIDLHNNTGHNPAYGVGPTAGLPELGLLRRFGERFVVTQLRLGALVEVMRELSAITVECGRAGDAAADEVALRGLTLFLEDETLTPLTEAEAGRIEVLIDPVRVRLHGGVELAVADAPVHGADFTLRADVDRHNFEEMPLGAPLGWVTSKSRWPLEVLGPDGVDRSRELFALHGGQLVTREPIVPIMMTTDVEIAHSDCLFYAVHRPATD